ncbi:MAG TPA: type IV pilus twitching motility protein PilT [Thermoanaerobaculia bacterium]|jgi:twitching motility protein PilT|nr:type IV pilus twitching motility protein PilT [Thermoanaerobaculia bacterium]
MPLGQDEVLFGRIALHYKLVSQDQLTQATTLWNQEGGLRGLGEILLESGVLNVRQLEQLRTVQRDYLAKQKQQQGQATPQAEAPQQPIVVQQPVPAPPPVASPAPAVSAGSWRQSPRRLEALLTYAVQQKASDLHLHSAAPVKLRRNGQLADLEDEPLTKEVSEAMIREILTPEQQRDLDEHGQIDFAYTIPNVGRFRANAYRQQRGMDAVFRAIPPNPPTLEELGLPANLSRFANYHQGMVLLTGPAGCGKSSTLAAMLNIINQDRQDHIISIEDPIEYIHRSQKCVVNQRQVGRHTNSFARALRAALREDPDIIAIGELRDLETISLALTAAETGHLVLGTLHTNNAIRTINRLLGVFPPEQQEQIRTMVSESLRAVVSQRLVTKADGSGRVPALEVLVCNKAVGNLIRDNKTFQIKSVLQTGGSQGMCLLDGSLADLVKNKVITREEAARHAEDPAKFTN